MENTTMKSKQRSVLFILLCAFCALVITVLALHLFVGLRYVNDKQHNLKFFGVMRSGNVSGKLYYEDGTTARVSSKKKTVKGSNGDLYEGDIEGYLPDGKGKLTKADGTVYEGDFEEGACTGEAKIVYFSKDVYEGSVKNGNREGFGTYKKADGSLYTGYFKENQKDKYGITFFSDKSVYIGEYDSAIKTGRGAYLFANGDIYVGHFKEDMRTGTGIYIWEKSKEFSSEFESLFDVEYSEEFMESFFESFDNRFALILSGEIPEEEAENSFFSDFEKIAKRRPIECYMGDFNENLLSGSGTYIWLSGRSLTGVFENGEIIKEPENSEE